MSESVQTKMVEDYTVSDVVSDATQKETHTPDNVDSFEVKYSWLYDHELSLKDKVKKIDEAGIALANEIGYDRRFPLDFKGKDGKYNNVKSYLNKLKNWVYSDIRYVQYEVVNVDNLHKEIVENLKTWTEGQDFLLSRISIETFVNCTLATPGHGSKSSSDRIYLLLPVHNIWVKIKDVDNELQELSKIKADFIQSIREDEEFEKLKARQEELKQQEEASTSEDGNV